MLARALRWSGGLAILERLARRPGLLVLGYHRVASKAENPGFDGVISADAAEFRRQVAYLRDRFRILRLEEWLDDGERSIAREPCVLITYDDGYRDNFEVALPILEELRVPAAFFLPTDFLDRPQLFWWDRLAAIVKRTEVGRLRLDGLDLDLTTLSRDAAIAALVDPFLAMHPDDRPRALDQLQDRAEVELDEPELARTLMMDWGMARGLLKAGMAVGSHARSHRELALLDESHQHDELAGSKQRLEEQLRHAVVTLAYPYGVARAVSETTRRLAREVGYQAAFAFAGGINRPGPRDPMALARINIGATDAGDLFRARMVLTSSFGRSLV
jgi:peptidoglycan/xylan/chitin deacetylase (PgdA/CDA1 family)